MMIGRWVGLSFAFSVAVLGCSQKYPGKQPDGLDPPNTPCANTRVCKVWGWCGEKNGECAATGDDMCRSSDACKKGGLCSQEGIRCVAKDDDCDRSQWCKDYGLCDATNGVCR